VTQAVYFAPLEPEQPQGPLARYRPPALAGAARWFVSQFTAPGDLVLDLFCQGAAYVRAAVLEGRRVVGSSANPLNLLAAGVGLEPLPPPAALNAAFTRLADSPKMDRPLRHHLADAYRTRCPACQKDGLALWFAWDREEGVPYAKAVRCPACGEVQEGPADEQDVAAVLRFEARGLAYHYALNRVAPVGHAARERAAELVDLYTPRNLSALMDVTRRLEGMDLARRVRAALQAVLLEAFDRGSSLDPHGEDRSRPRTLRPPAHFLERNVWLLFEREIERLTGPRAAEPAPVRRAASLDELLSGRTPGYVLLPSPAREIASRLPASSAALILADPARPDAVYWALSALWAGWLWDAPAAHALRPFLSRRRFDWEWHRGVLGSALAAAAPLLGEQGRVVTLFDHEDEQLLESVCPAASAAGYELPGWGAGPGAGRQFVWQPCGTPSRARRWWASLWPAGRQEPPSEDELPDFVAGLARECLQERGEPTPWITLHATICAGVARAGEESIPDLRPALTEGLAQLALERVTGQPDRRWSPALPAQDATLADRVEEQVWEILQAQAAWPAGDLLRRIYAHFGERLTPEPSLVHACLVAYASFREGMWWLREEEQPDRRAGEMGELRRDLRSLGKRLGFDVRRGRGWDVRWQEDGRSAYLFTLSATASVGHILLAGPSVPSPGRPCLILPGSRISLLKERLERDPRLARIAQQRGWLFLPFHRMHHLIEEARDRRILEAILQLDPAAEWEGVQIPLMLGGEE
jgi:hypothetical protein